MNNKSQKKKGSGFRIVIIFLLIIVGASMLLTGGIFPKLTNSVPPNQGQENIPITPNPEENNQENKSLQLKTFGFKTPSPTPQNCAETITVDFLLDRTGSMANSTPTGVEKIKRLKEAVLELTGNLDDNSIVGIQSFNSESITNDVPISYYRDVKTLIPTKVNALRASGQTPTHDALRFSYNVLQNALPNFPNRKFNFVFVSDGAPCPGTGCPSDSGQNQDPRLYTPNPADQIKALGVNVFTLAVYDPTQARDPSFSDLLKSIASTPTNYYEAQSADQIANLLQQITAKLCQ